MRHPGASILRLSEMSFRQARAHSDLSEAEYSNDSSDTSQRAARGNGALERKAKSYFYALRYLEPSRKRLRELRRLSKCVRPEFSHWEIFSCPFFVHFLSPFLSSIFRSPCGMLFYFLSNLSTHEWFTSRMKDTCPPVSYSNQSSRHEHSFYTRDFSWFDSDPPLIRDIYNVIEKNHSKKID